jgi:hypothetical protein
VQHDGGGWRCLVASHLAAIPDRYFQPSAAGEIRRGTEGRLAAAARATFVPAIMHGLHELSAAKAVPPEQLRGPALLAHDPVIPGHNLPDQYLQVTSKYIFPAMQHLESRYGLTILVTRCFNVEHRRFTAPFTPH